MFKPLQTTALVISTLASTASLGSPVAAAEPRLRMGTYEGKATVAAQLNGMEFKSNGVIKLKIKKNENGKVGAHVEFLNGLFGEGDLSGTFDSSGNLKLTGPLSAGIEFEFKLNARLDKEGDLKGSYRCIFRTGPGIASEQKGKFQAKWEEDD